MCSENVALALRVANAPEPRIQNRVREVLSLTNLSHKADRLPRELSAGEQQRVAIARAVANEPYAVLADEPTGNLDPETSLGHPADFPGHQLHGHGGIDGDARTTTS